MTVLREGGRLAFGGRDGRGWPARRACTCALFAPLPPCPILPVHQASTPPPHLPSSTLFQAMLAFFDLALYSGPAGEAQQRGPIVPIEPDDFLQTLR